MLCYVMLCCSKFILDGYLYVRQTELAKDVEVYECEKRRRNACKAKIHVRDNVCVNYVNEHTHAPEVCKAEAMIVRQEMKRRAEETEETPQQIIAQ